MGQTKRNDDLPPTPWLKILTSVPVMALICAQVCSISSTWLISYRGKNKSLHLFVFIFRSDTIGCFTLWGKFFCAILPRALLTFFLLFSADLPKYLKDVLKFEVYDVGLYSSLPYLGMWIFSLLSGFLSDFLIVRGFISITQARKIFTGLGECYRAIQLRACWHF